MAPKIRCFIAERIEKEEKRAWARSSSDLGNAQHLGILQKGRSNPQEGKDRRLRSGWGMASCLDKTRSWGSRDGGGQIPEWSKLRSEEG